MNANYDGFVVSPIQQDRGAEFFYRNDEYTVSLRSMEQVIELGSPNMVKEFAKWAKVDLDKRGQDGMSYLHQAACIGDPDKIKALIDLGISPNVKDDFGCTPLHYVSASQDQELTLFEKGMRKLGFEPRRYEKSAEMLIKEGADKDAQDQDGNTPLHLAAESKLSKVADTLVRTGADRSIENHEGKTARDMAMEKHNYDFAKSIAPEHEKTKATPSRSKEHEMEI